MNLKELIQEAKKEIFSPEYVDKATDSETLGIMISKYGKWNGGFIFEVATSAFEDSNFHSFNAKFSRLWDDEECLKVEGLKQ